MLANVKVGNMETSPGLLKAPIVPIVQGWSCSGRV